MGKRSILKAGITIVVGVACVGALLGYDASQQNVLAHGVSIGGIDVGGMSVGKARARLTDAFQSSLHRPIVLRFQRRRFVLTPRAAHATVKFDSALQQALQQSRSGWIIGRVIRSLTGGSIYAPYDPTVHYSRSAVRALVARAARTLDRPARNAGLSYSGSSVGVVPQRLGVRVRTSALTQSIQSVLADPTQSRQITIPAQLSRPTVTVDALAADHPTVITVDRLTFQLRLWKHLKLARTYPIAVGMIGLETPAGLYHVQDKQVDPSWFVPDSAWAGSLAGQVIPPGPADPLKARWMGLVNGAGIHGIDPSEYGSIGHDASHGCIRMTIPDVINLYNQTSVGTPVYIE